MSRNSTQLPAHIRSVSLDFLEFLHETNRINITDKQKIQQIYNNEFKISDGVKKDPRFSSVLYALRLSDRARRGKNGRVYLSRNVRVVLRDQWWKPRNSHQSASYAQTGSSGTSPLPHNTPECSSSATPSHPGPEGGVRARRKLAQEILDKLKNERSKFVADKHGVHIISETGLVSGKTCFCVDTTEYYEQRLLVENKGASSVYFTYYSPLHWIHCFMFDDSEKVTRSNPLQLRPGETYEITVMFRAEHVGVYSVVLVFEFKKSMQMSSKPFHILHTVEAEFRTPLAAELKASEPYKRPKVCSPQNVDFTVDEGVQPEDIAQNFLKNEVPLLKYSIPPYINDLITALTNCTRPSSSHLQKIMSLLESPLSFQNYAERFQVLLYLEESQMHVDIKSYNKEDVTMKRDMFNKNLLVLNVPGVSENRPSVLRGDHLLITKSEDLKLPNLTKYKGYVHRVALDQLKLGFSKRFLSGFIDKMRFTVEFTVNRILLRLQHRAVQLAVQHKLQDVLFPTRSNAATRKAELSLRLFDRHLEQNIEQYTAVCNIVAGVSKPAPYLVFGPPGTGKTVTVVEAIKQVEKTGANVRILACAPSNSAADQLCEKLLQHVDPYNVFRMYASSRDPEFVPPSLLECCNLIGEMYEFPSKEELMEYKIVVTTVCTAGRLITGGLPVGHFTHIFLDEAGHAVESEAIIAIAGLLNVETGQLVLAGDPKQLGPILRSPIAKKYGLGLSLLARLMDQNPLYQKGETGYNTCYVTKLLRNYRSHKSILKIPNELFYDGELQPFADEFSTSFYLNWEELPKRGFPMIFHGVPGKDEQESNSPSFFNTSEIIVVVNYLKKLLLTQSKKGIAKVSPKDIGIITPYRKQVEKLRKAIIRCDKELCNYRNITELKVGSVEEFQGQERRVIIVSTVRSCDKYITIDKTFNIGFLSNEKRFNVAVTRARSLLIVVGNPIILSSDPTWSRFIDYCSAEGGYTGLNRAIVEGTEDVVARLTALSIQTEPETDPVNTEASAVQQYVNPEWRNEQ
ncbi:putative helicase mov-10-B.2 [Hoplias malabaricus]|uniref:putative helicase mov-10-B.2 n=1 Tax=Hoplias malabaricus TaxID=27720 RepID=UPI0034634922